MHFEASVAPFMIPNTVPFDSEVKISPESLPHQGQEASVAFSADIDRGVPVSEDESQSHDVINEVKVGKP